MSGAGAKTLVIGVGNRFRGDDAVGIIIASRLKRFAGGDFTIVETVGEGIAMMQAWSGANKVIILDAAMSGDEPGTIHCIDAARQRVPHDLFHYSTHSFNVAEVIELARALGRLPPHTIIYGIEGKDFGLNAKLSPEVERAAELLMSKVLDELELEG